MPLQANSRISSTLSATWERFDQRSAPRNQSPGPYRVYCFSAVKIQPGASYAQWQLPCACAPEVWQASRICPWTGCLSSGPHWRFHIKCTEWPGYLFYFCRIFSFRHSRCSLGTFLPRSLIGPHLFFSLLLVKNPWWDGLFEFTITALHRKAFLPYVQCTKAWNNRGFDAKSPGQFTRQSLISSIKFLDQFTPSTDKKNYGGGRTLHFHDRGRAAPLMKVYMGYCRKYASIHGPDIWRNKYRFV